MSCHVSCSTCISSLFNECSTCPSQSVLSNGACFCALPWDSTCTNSNIYIDIVPDLRYILQIADSLFMAIIPLVMLCYCLKAKLLISYRILVGLQSISMLLFTTQSYLNYETIVALSTLYKSNGYYGFTYRNETISYAYILPAIILFFTFLILYAMLQRPHNLFVKKQENYYDYLTNNAFNFFSYFYMFGSRNMLFFMGLWLSKMQMNIVNIIFAGICGIFVLISVVKAVRDFHNNKIQDQIYEPEIYLYNVLSPLSMIGLPLATTTIPLLFIYLSPVCLLILIIIFNKNYEIFTKPKIMFYLAEALISGLAVAFIMVDYTLKGIVVIIALIFGILIIIVQSSVTYHGGFKLKSSKIHPETNASFNSMKKDEEADKNIIKHSIRKQSTYF